MKIEDCGRENIGQSQSLHHPRLFNVRESSEKTKRTPKETQEGLEEMRMKINVCKGIYIYKSSVIIVFLELFYR